jgi:YHS domain-containing protein
LTYDGQLFRFSSAEARSLFLAEPERYLPRNQGRCIVAQVDKGSQVAGDPAFGVYYQGRLYLCSSAQARTAFAAAPERYADADLGLAGHCPHCRQVAGRMVPGSDEYPLTLQGTRYLFPDASHREAFLADLERAVR